MEITCCAGIVANIVVLDSLYKIAKVPHADLAKMSALVSAEQRNPKKQVT